MAASASPRWIAAASSAIAPPKRCTRGARRCLGRSAGAGAGRRRRPARRCRRAPRRPRPRRAGRGRRRGRGGRPAAPPRRAWPSATATPSTSRRPRPRRGAAGCRGRGGTGCGRRGASRAAGAAWTPTGRAADRGCPRRSAWPRPRRAPPPEPGGRLARRRGQGDAGRRATLGRGLLVEQGEDAGDRRGLAGPGTTGDDGEAAAHDRGRRRGRCRSGVGRRGTAGPDPAASTAASTSAAGWPLRSSRSAAMRRSSRQ